MFFNKLCFVFRQLVSVVRQNVARPITIMNLCLALTAANLLFMFGMGHTESKVRLMRILSQWPSDKSKSFVCTDVKGHTQWSAGVSCLWAISHL